MSVTKNGEKWPELHTLTSPRKTCKEHEKLACVGSTVKASLKLGGINGSVSMRKALPRNRWSYSGGTARVTS